MEQTPYDIGYNLFICAPLECLYPTFVRLDAPQVFFIPLKNQASDPDFPRILSQNTISLPFLQGLVLDLGDLFFAFRKTQK
ncbi:hypothetical protein B0E43_10115 [Algoriphagus sp. A40]|nr:hypothetical protein B0E43_10115 [Algoriphagus sp. A40]